MRKLILLSFCLLVVMTASCFASDSNTCMQKQTIEERIENLEKMQLYNGDRNSELEEKIDSLAEGIGYRWRRQLARGTWIKDKSK